MYNVTVKSLLVGMFLICFAVPAIAQFPEENPLLVIAETGRVLEESGATLSDRSMPVADRLTAAAQMFRDLTVNVPAEPTLSLLSTSIARSMSGIARAAQGGSVEDVILNLAEYRAALNQMALGVAKEVAVAQRTDPEQAEELGLPAVSLGLLTSVHFLDVFLAEEAPQLSTENLEDGLAVAFTRIGGDWGRSALGLRAWGGSNLSTWTGGCRCGEREGSWVCVVDSGLFCDTCEWANTDPGPNG
ncbi:MAG: hypothetical protein JWQ89_4515 [Devosia sp.]|uniref:hypothetical protein n=1 Tax=Devosia sp. TaxID=1871048 RepID=UPI002617CC36|nr:hypothetical protein [Devosia sp.]MDB5542788.1 hypothetical protein [Devosia sp.]